MSWITKSSLMVHSGITNEGRMRLVYCLPACFAVSQMIDTMTIWWFRPSGQRTSRWM